MYQALYRAPGILREEDKVSALTVLEFYSGKRQ